MKIDEINDGTTEKSESLEAAEILAADTQDALQTQAAEDADEAAKKALEAERIQRSKESLSNILKGNSRFMFSIIPMAFIVVLVFSLLTQTGLLLYSNGQLGTYQTKLAALEDEYQNKMSEVNDKYMEEKLNKMLTANDLYIYTSSLWTYSLLANNEPVPVAMVPALTAPEISAPEISVSADANSVTIVLTETQAANPLPAAIINIGRVTQGSKDDSLEKHIFVEDYNANRKVTGEGNITKIEFVVENVQSGDKISITLSDQLAEKLNTPFTNLTLLVK